MIYDEFVIGTASKMTYEECVSFFSHTNDSHTPITLIALFDNTCVGTVSLFEQDGMRRKDLSPWLASFYVDPAYRSQKIGQSLMNALFEKCRELGLEMIYLKTEHTSQYYANRGWKLIDSFLNDPGEKTDVFSYLITD
jgi:N-acetylglutamate synthase-like GNAT family acetyltransferase